MKIIAEWGLHPFNFQDNPTRACIAALNIQRTVKEFITKGGTISGQSFYQMDDRSRQDRHGSKSMATSEMTKTNTFYKDDESDSEDEIELPIHIGIATGQVFQALVGDDEASS